MEEIHEEGISRRKVLKRMGAGVAVAWTAPVLTSLGSPAFAQASPTCRPYDCLDPEFPFCGPDSACGLPPGCTEFNVCIQVLNGSCFCTAARSCNTDPLPPICQSDADCEPLGPGSRCAEIFNCGCSGDRVCWFPCGSSGPRPRKGQKVIQPG